MATDVPCAAPLFGPSPAFWVGCAFLGDNVQFTSIFRCVKSKHDHHWKITKKILLMILSNGFWILFKCTWTNLEQLAMQVLSLKQRLFSNTIARAKRALTQSRNFCISITIFALIVFILFLQIDSNFRAKIRTRWFSNIPRYARTYIHSVCHIVDVNYRS